MRINSKRIGYLTGLCFLISLVVLPAALAQADLHEEQARERIELQKMREEIGKIKSTMKDAREAMSQVNAQIEKARVKEFKLTAQKIDWELFPGKTVEAIGYNGAIPGPVIRVRTGERVKISLVNKLGMPTSLYFHGMSLPHPVDGLPRKGKGLIGPGETYVYEFVPERPGTYWYHPQVIHAGQQMRGLYGAIVVESSDMSGSFARDYPLVLGDFLIEKPAGTRTSGKNDATKSGAGQPIARAVSSVGVGKSGVCQSYFTINGKCAPAIPPIKLSSGERVRFRVINAGGKEVPLYLTGHTFEVVSKNGSDSLEPHITRDTITVKPGDRLDLEINADNPGVWSLSSVLPEQNTNMGRFPGGIACVVRYEKQ